MGNPDDTDQTRNLILVPPAWEATDNTRISRAHITGVHEFTARRTISNEKNSDGNYNVFWQIVSIPPDWRVPHAPSIHKNTLHTLIPFDSIRSNFAGVIEKVNENQARFDQLTSQTQRSKKEFQDHVSAFQANVVRIKTLAADLERIQPNHPSLVHVQQMVNSAQSISLSVPPQSQSVSSYTTSMHPQSFHNGGQSVMSESELSTYTSVCGNSSAYSNFQTTPNGLLTQQHPQQSAPLSVLGYHNVPSSMQYDYGMSYGHPSGNAPPILYGQTSNVAGNVVIPPPYH